MARKLKLKMEDFLIANRVMFQLKRTNVTQLDFTCIFQKDLTLTQKRFLKKQFGNDIVKVLNCFFIVPVFAKKFNAKFRKDIKTKFNPTKGTWSAKIIKPKAKKKK